MFRTSSSAPLFFFPNTATTAIYTLSLHDALPICVLRCGGSRVGLSAGPRHRDHAARVVSIAPANRRTFFGRALRPDRRRRARGASVGRAGRESRLARRGGVGFGTRRGARDRKSVV